MKALILDVTGHHNEAVELSKTAVTKDMKSHVCWHIYGMIMRSDRKFVQAVKSLKTALNLSADNPQILRDLALVQAHIRDFKGFQVRFRFCFLMVYFVFLVDTLYSSSIEA